MKLTAAKSLLKMNCCTSDCWGLVSKFLWKDKFGNEIKELVQEEIDKEDKTIKAGKAERNVKKSSNKIIKVIPKKQVNKSLKINEKTCTPDIINSESSNSYNKYSDTFSYEADVKIVIRNNKSPKNEDNIICKKRKQKQKQRLTMSLGEYQNSFLGQSVRTDLEFTNFTSVLIDIKRKHHLTHMKAKDLLVSAVGMTRYVPTKYLSAIYDKVEEELIQEQEAIQEAIQEAFQEDVHKQERILSSTADFEDPEIEECSICCDEILNNKEVGIFRHIISS